MDALLDRVLGSHTDNQRVIHGFNLVYRLCSHFDHSRAPVPGSRADQWVYGVDNGPVWNHVALVVVQFDQWFGTVEEFL